MRSVKMMWYVSWSEVRNTSLPKLATLHVPSGKSNELVESSEWSHSESQFIIQECPLPTGRWKVVTLRAWVQNSPATLYRKSRWVLPLEFADYLRPGGDSQHTGTRQYCWCPRRVKPASLSRDPFIVRNMIGYLLPWSVNEPAVQGGRLEMSLHPSVRVNLILGALI